MPVDPSAAPPGQSSTAATQSPRDPRRRRRLIALVALGAVVLTAPIWLALGFRVFVLEAFRIPSPSMVPALRPGDSLLADERVRGQMPSRGDVVVFTFPRDASKDYVSRVVAVAGDRVQVRADGTVEPGGAALARCGLGRRAVPDGRPQEHEYDVRLERNGERRYLVLRDPDRGVTVPPEESHCVVEPCTVPAGHVLTLGDNRDNSYDGRYWGFVPVANIRARARWLHSPTLRGPEGRWMRDVHDEPVVPAALAPALARCLAALR